MTANVTLRLIPLDYVEGSKQLRAFFCRTEQPSRAMLLLRAVAAALQARADEEVEDPGKELVLSMETVRAAREAAVAITQDLSDLLPHLARALAGESYSIEVQEEGGWKPEERRRLTEALARVVGFDVADESARELLVLLDADTLEEPDEEG